MRYTYHPIKKDEEAREFAQEVAKRFVPYLLDQLSKKARDSERVKEIYVE
jgi:bisphosphoglycerate-dependent phosphoglycerate mutase